nr:ROK family protein [Secundilactobacillus kimchicus]
MRSLYIGVDLGGTNIKLGLLSDQFTALWLGSVPTESLTNSEVVMTNLINGLRRLMTENNVTPADISAIGVGVPGQMDIKRGISIFSPNFANWDNVPVVQRLTQEFGLPVYIDNDVRVNLYGEWQFGQATGLDNVVMVTLGTGLGAAAIVDGKMLYGHSNSATELGHMNMVRQGGRPCACGSSGCFARYVSARGIIWTVRDHLAAGESSLLTEWVAGDVDAITPKMVSEAYDQGDLLAERVYTETAEMLGFGLANVINLYNPKRIVMGGGVAQAGDRLLKPAIEIAMSHSLKVARQDCDIVAAKLGSKAGAYGAGYMAAIRFAEESAEEA